MIMQHGNGLFQVEHHQLQMKNPIVTYDQEGTYDVALTITNSYGTDTQLIPNFINYSNDLVLWKDLIVMEIVKIIFIQLLVAQDSYGDGWNGNILDILVDGEPFNQYTLSSGYSEEVNICIL